MKVIILAAGQGRRLKPLTAEKPKSAVEIDGRTLLEWQLGELAQVPVDEIVVVTGFAPRAIHACLAGMDEPRVRTVHNPFYARADNLGTCWIARAEFDGPCLLINGDTLFEAAIPQRLLGYDGMLPITLATDHKTAYDDDDMKIAASDSRLQRVSKRLHRDQVNGESIGMMAFSREGAALFREKLEALMREPEGLTRWYLSAIDELARERRVGICSINGLAWCEVDELPDLDDARRLVRSLAPLATAVQA